MAQLGAQMHAESQFARYNYDIEKVQRMLHYLIDKPDAITIVAVDDKDTVFGGFIGDINYHYFGNDKVASDVAIFVKQDKRGSLAAFKLIKEYVLQAKENGADQIIIANSTGVMPDKVKSLFEAIGFVQYGYVFAMGSR